MSDLPANIRFSGFRQHPTNEDYDQLDIIMDGKVIHTMDVNMSRCMGSMHEYALHLDAYGNARQWLLERRLLPAKAAAA